MTFECNPFGAKGCPCSKISTNNENGLTLILQYEALNTLSYKPDKVALQG